MKIKDLIAHLQTYDPEAPVAAGIWLAADVQSCADALGVTLSEDDIANILGDVHDGHDAGYGITWDTLDFYVQNAAEDDAS